VELYLFLYPSISSTVSQLKYLKFLCCDQLGAGGIRFLGLFLFFAGDSSDAWFRNNQLFHKNIKPYKLKNVAYFSALQFYPNQAHSLNSGSALRHVYQQLDLRLSHCLGKTDSPYEG